MPSLKNVGPTPTSVNALATRKKTDDVLTGLVTPAAMQSRIDAAVAPYATKSYVDQQDGLLTTKAYVDQQDALYIPNSWKGAPNGVAELVSGAVPSSRIPTVPTMPMIHAKTFRDTDFNNINIVGTGSGEAATILNTTIPMTTNGQYVRFMAFGNFEGFSVVANGAPNLTGRCVFKVYINNFLCAQSANRSGGGSTTTSFCSVMPCGDDLGHTPASGWAQSSATIKVTVSTPQWAGVDTAVDFIPTPLTLLSVYLVYA